MALDRSAGVCVSLGAVAVLAGVVYVTLVFVVVLLLLEGLLQALARGPGPGPGGRGTAVEVLERARWIRAPSTSSR